MRFNVQLKQGGPVAADWKRSTTTTSIKQTALLSDLGLLFAKNSIWIKYFIECVSVRVYDSLGFRFGLED